MIIILPYSRKSLFRTDFLPEIVNLLELNIVMILSSLLRNLLHLVEFEYEQKKMKSTGEGGIIYILNGL
jgi:hypothetical protein